MSINSVLNIIMTLAASNLYNTVVPIYRSYLRQIQQLPHFYVKHFFKLKAADDVRRILKSDDNVGLLNQRVKRLSKDMRRVKAANSGNAQAFKRILDLAYGRKGKLKWEIMNSLLSDPNTAIPQPIIPAREKSRPPVYSSELIALLTSSYSRKSKKALASRFLQFPPTLPERADPSSKSARLFGPFSKRREVNLRWRYFTTEWKKVLPPLEVNVYKDTAKATRHMGQSDKTRPIGLQDLGMHEAVEVIVGPSWVPKNLTRKEKRNMEVLIQQDSSRHPSRWLRRRYQQLLGRLPKLNYSYSAKKAKGDYSVSLSPSATGSHVKNSSHHLPEITSAQLAWVTLSTTEPRSVLKRS